MKLREQKQLSLLTEIASLYYEKNMTQSEIAERMFLSRTRISRMLQQAIEKGIVQIHVNHIFERNYALEERFKQIFSLRDIYLYNTHEKTPQEVKSGVCILAAEYLKKRITKPIVLGTSWGSTIAETVNSLKIETQIPIDVVQIMGAASIQNPEINANELVSRIAKIYGGIPHYLNVPLYIENDFVKQKILLDPIIANVLDMALNSDIILTGIGTFDEITAFNPWLGYMTQSMFREIKNQNAIGCIGAHFYDKNGNALDNDWNKNCVGISLSNLYRMEEVVAVASGTSKAQAILGAIRGGYINVLVTDTDTANSIIDLH
ncbi:DNA-binding transcriptional regulator LsrR (DeoR family) [Ruminiclostridium sufflavum DSM 19573]|uniref:DNA-binding transcriptional regulator LsrR (DeoR family) n=1 Tax=Ruminiclostridium sufflavum DSM 19573 TaxID=1121337 RepID=A0A318XUF0_9FIRM|nr:sugar-binding domain-containing protein [Ruminiclostridium sufflavum]PYG90280.1 DNA-binding transcriptional regulator LsrR (DeoR family) [Ruminiclostridium sufflavum DSM 19573]